MIATCNDSPRPITSSSSKLVGLSLESERYKGIGECRKNGKSKNGRCGSLKKNYGGFFAFEEREVCALEEIANTKEEVCVCMCMCERE